MVQQSLNIVVMAAGEAIPLLLLVEDKHSKAKQFQAKQSQAKQIKVKPSKAKQGEAKQGETKQSAARQFCSFLYRQDFSLILINWKAL